MDYTDLSVLLIRWQLRLRELIFEIKYLKCISIPHANALSRLAANGGILLYSGKYETLILHFVQAEHDDEVTCVEVY